MSGLAGVLAGRHDAGVHRWHNALHVPDVQHAVEHAGWTFGYVDGVALESKKEILGAIGDALSFPDHYGGNLDALRDCLRDLPQEHRAAVGRLGEPGPGQAGRLRKVCRVLGKRADGEPTLEVLLRGPGPDDTGITSLD